MALKKLEVVDLIEVLESGAVQVRVAIRIMENDEIISSSSTRHVVIPGQDYSQEDPKVQAICAVVQTPEVIAAYKAAQESQQVLTPAA